MPSSCPLFIFFPNQFEARLICILGRNVVYINLACNSSRPQRVAIYCLGSGTLWPGMDLFSLGGALQHVCLTLIVILGSRLLADKTLNTYSEQCCLENVCLVN